jgi:chromosome segregation ATPase
MDTQLTTASERAAQLKTRIVELGMQHREIESRHGKERGALATGEEKRLELIAELVSADPATEGYLNDEIDKIDSQLIALGRKAASLERSLSAIEAERASHTVEFNELQQAIAESARVEAVKSFQTKMEQAAKEASDALANARERLSALNRLAAQGAEAYGQAGLRICNAVIEPFVLEQANTDAGGWKPSTPSYTRLEFWIRSLTRG